MHRILLALALVAGAAAPSLAMDAATMSCADFTKMDDADRMAAMGGGMMSGDSGGMMATTGESGAMAKSGGDAGGMMASSGDAGGMMAGDHAKMASEACAMHPDMTVGEAMKAK